MGAKVNDEIVAQVTNLNFVPSGTRWSTHQTPLLFLCRDEQAIELGRLYSFRRRWTLQVGATPTDDGWLYSRAQVGSYPVPVLAMRACAEAGHATSPA